MRVISVEHPTNSSTKITVGTGFYSKAAYDALMLVDCLEAGCWLTDLCIGLTNATSRKDHDVNYSMNSWIKAEGHIVLPSTYAHIPGVANPWNNLTEIVNDFTTGEILFKVTYINDSGKLVSEFPGSVISALISSIFATYNFIKPLNYYDNIVYLESEGTAFLNPYTFHGGHFWKEEANSRMYWEEYLSKNHGRPTYKHQVDRCVFAEMLHCYVSHNDPHNYSTLTSDCMDPFRLQIEKEIYAKIAEIRDNAKTYFKAQCDHKTTSEITLTTYYEILKGLESMQQAVRNEMLQTLR